MIIKEISNTKKMVQLEISSYEFNKNDFFEVWDEVRDKYSERLYSIDKIEKEKYKVTITLLKKKIKI